MTDWEQIRSQHQELAVECARLRVLAAAPRQLLSDTEWRAVLMGDLRTFHDQLRAHFDLEEEGGYMRDVTEKHPQLHHRAQGLAGDHDRFRQRVADLLAEAESSDKLDAVRSGLLKLLESLVRHESAERELIQEAFLTDEGGPG